MNILSFLGLTDGNWRIKAKNFIIKFLGGFTNEEYEVLLGRYQKLLDEEKDDKTIQVCNETSFRNLSILDDFAKSLYGLSPNIWSKKMYNVIHANKLYVLLMHLSDPSSHILFKVNPHLESNKEISDEIALDHKETSENTEEVINE